MSLSPMIKKIYEDRLLTNKQIEEQRVKAVYSEHPYLEELDIKIKTQMIEDTLNKLNNKTSSDNDNTIEELKRLKSDYIAKNNIDTNYLEAHYHCSKCRDLGYLDDGTTCSCYIKLKSELLIAQSPLKERLDNDTFDNFKLDYYSSEIANNRKNSPRDYANSALKVAREYVDTFPNGKNLFFYGTVGVGKTFITTCIAGELLKKAFMVCYLPASDLFEIMGNHQFNRPEVLPTSYEDIRDCDLLIIDDLGTELQSGFVDSALFDIVNNRGIKKKSTIISTNLNLNQMKDNYTDRVASRIFEQYEVVPIYGNDIRTVKRFQ